MDLLKTGAELLQQKLGTSADTDTITSALSGLVGDGKGGIDIAGLVTQMTSSSDLQSLAKSWLGDGANDSISASKIMSILGEGKVTEFAGKLGVDTTTAASGLSDVLPQLVDKASSGGNILESLGGAGGLKDIAKKFF